MSYEAFPSGATVYPASAFSAPSHPHPKPAAILQADDSALDWLQRDAASPNAPAALKTLQGCRSLLSMISGGGGGSHSGSAAAAAAVAATPAELSTGDVCELFGRSGSGKTEMLYSCIATNILPKVKQQQQHRSCSKRQERMRISLIICSFGSHLCFVSTDALQLRPRLHAVPGRFRWRRAGAGFGLPLQCGPPAGRAAGRHHQGVRGARAQTNG